MPERSGYIASGALHLGLVLILLFGLPNFFPHHLPEETPLVVQLVKIGPETRATQLTKTPPQPEAKPEIAEAPPPPKPVPPTPAPPKPTPKPQPPPTVAPAPQPAPPQPPPPQPKVEPTPPAPPPPMPQPKPEPPPPVPKPEAITPPLPKPEVKPQPKVAPPPPPPPKPAPPKPKAAEQAAFNSLLKNLEQNDPVEDQPDKTQDQPAPAHRRASSQPVAPLGSQLTASELDLVKQQIYECWNVPVGARGAADLTPEFRVTMNPDATVRTVTLINTERYGEPFFRAAADSARRALFNPECSPLKLPPDKYNQWQTFTITFDPKDIAG